MRWTIFALALALSGAVQAQPQRHAISPKAQGILYPTPIAITSWFTPNDFPPEAMQRQSRVFVAAERVAIVDPLDTAHDRLRLLTVRHGVSAQEHARKGEVKLRRDGIAEI